MARNTSLMQMDQIRYSEDFFRAAGDALELPWTDAASAGGTHDFRDDIFPGVFRLAHSAVGEAQIIHLDFGDQLVISPTRGPVFECRLAINSGTPSADQRAVWGLASAHNATLDSIVDHCWFRWEGANNNIFVEGDDGTTDTDDTDSTFDWVSGTFRTYLIDMTDLAAVRFVVDGQAFGTTVNVSAMAAGDHLQPYFCIQKDAGTETDSLDIDYCAVYWRRA